MIKRLIVCGVVLLALILAFVGGYVTAGLEDTAYGHAEYALKKSGLSTEYAPSYSLHGFTGFRDTFSQTKFVVEHQREKLFSEIKYADGWRVSPVMAEEYMQFQRTCMWGYETLDVPSDVVFDAWYYHETSAPSKDSPCMTAGTLAEIGQVGYGFEFAVYDVETGLFIFVDLFG